jgi:uncharacterized protein YxjI
MNTSYTEGYDSNPYEDDYHEVSIQNNKPTPVAGSPYRPPSQRVLPPPPSAPVEEHYNDPYEYDYKPKTVDTEPEQQPTYQPTIEQVRRAFEVHVTGPGKLCLYENDSPLYSVVIDLKNFKLEVRDATQKICAYVRANLMPIRDTYLVQLPSGIEVGVFTKRLKLNLSGDRKYHYVNKISDEKLKIVGNIKRGIFNIVRGDDKLGTWSFSNETGGYSVVMDRMTYDESHTLHIVCFLFVSILDHIATRKPSSK